MLGLWRPFDSWDDEALVTARVASTVPLVESGLREMQREVRTFYRQVLREMDIPSRGGAPVIELYPRSGVDLLDVYKRPVREFVKARESGADPMEAFEARLSSILDLDMRAAGRDELARIQGDLVETGLAVQDSVDDISDTDVVLDEQELVDVLEAREDAVTREQELAREDAREQVRRARDVDGKRQDDAARGERITGWRRVIRPELSKTGSCGLCVVAATRMYHRHDLNAIHGKCKCIVLPVTKSNDPGLRLNNEDLQRIYGSFVDKNGRLVSSTQSASLKRTRVRVTKHGELGPVLAYSPKRGWVEDRRARLYEPKTEKVQVAEWQKRLKELEYTVSVLSFDKKANAEPLRELDRLIQETRAKLAA